MNKEQPLKPSNTIENPETLARIRVVFADKIEEIGRAGLENAIEKAKKVRAGEKIPWSVFIDEYLIGTLMNQFRIRSAKDLDLARNIFFEWSAEEIKKHLEKDPLHYYKPSG